MALMEPISFVEELMAMASFNDDDSIVMSEMLEAAYSLYCS